MQSCDNCQHKCLEQFLNENECKTFVANRTELHYEEGEIILKQGAYIAQVLFIKSGFVKLVLQDKYNKNVVLKVINEGNFVALPVLSDLEVYPYTIIALKSSVVCHIRKDTINAFLKNNHQLTSFVLNWFSHDFLFFYERLTMLSARNSHGKLAFTLLYLDKTIGKNRNLWECISRKDLSDLASISIDSTNKILSELKNDKIIEIKSKYIKILNPELIKKLSEIG